MAMSRELYLALLAMDSYNRGQNPGIDLQQTVGGKTGVGRATVLDLSETQRETANYSDWGEYGFSAAAYRLSSALPDTTSTQTGNLVISYRGTDDLSDLAYGWTVGAGYPGASQAGLAIDFYEAISGHDVDDVDGIKPLVTGHSLGGGLAGMVSLLSGSEGIGFDHMPYGVAAWIHFAHQLITTYIDMLCERKATLSDGAKALFASVIAAIGPQLQALIQKGLTAGVDGLDDYLNNRIDKATPEGSDRFERVENAIMQAIVRAAKDELIDFTKSGIGPLSERMADALKELAEKANQDTIAAWNLHLPQWDDFEGIAVDGEALALVRNGQVSGLLQEFAKYADIIGRVHRITAPVFMGIAQTLRGFSKVAEIIEQGVQWAQNNIEQTTLSTYGWQPSLATAYQRHRASLAVILQYAEDNFSAASAGWKQRVISGYALPTFADTQLARGNNITSVGPFSGLSSGLGAAMAEAIAYTAVDEGAMPFGNTGLRAILNDLNDLGVLYSAPNHDPVLDAENFVIGINTDDGVSFSVRAPIYGALTQIAIQYGGALAIYQVMAGRSQYRVEEGVIALSADQRTFAIDLSRRLWLDALRAGSAAQTAINPISIAGQESLVGTLLEQTDEMKSMWQRLLGNVLHFGAGTFNHEGLNQIVRWGWNASDWRTTIDRIQMRAVTGVSDFQLSDRSYAPGSYGANAQVDFYVGTASAETIRDSRGNDLILSSDGDDTLHVGAGSDFILAGRGNDRIYDYALANNQTGGRGGSNDLYIGDIYQKPLLESWADWLGKLTGLWGDTDTLIYTLRDQADASQIAQGGLRITRLFVGQMDRVDTVVLETRHDGTGAVSYDRLVDIERVVMTERGDSITLNNDMLRTPIWIDLGEPGKGTDYGPSDWDRLSYAELGQGIITVNGATQANVTGNGPVSNVSYLRLLADLVASAVNIPLPATGVIQRFVSNDALRVSGAEDITLTGQDDVLWYGPIGRVTGALLGWPAGDAYAHYGRIDGGAGHDILVVRDVEYIGQGDKLDPSDPDSAVATEDMRMTVYGGDGEDRIMLIGGDGGIAVGGAGRDFLFNWTWKGQLWGDNIDGSGGGQDVFWWSPGSLIMDAEQHDILQIFGVPLVGGVGSQTGEATHVRDWIFPWIRYGLTDANQLIVSDGNPNGLNGDELHDQSLVVNNFKFGQQTSAFMTSSPGTLGMRFRVESDNGTPLNAWHSIWGYFIAYVHAFASFAKKLHWSTDDDPLAIDLDGDGLETVQMDFGPQFDLDGDAMAQRTGWIGSDDGLLVRDLNGNGKVDDVSELFGAPGVSGFEMLRQFDGNRDGYIDAQDAVWSTLRVWRDRNSNALTDAGELNTLAATGIVRIQTGGTVLNQTVASGNTLRERGAVQWVDGRNGAAYDVVFETRQFDTRYLGDTGAADWSSRVDSRGYGRLTQLLTASANDIRVNTAVRTTAAAMTLGNLDQLRAQAQPVFDAWANTQPDSRELTPIIVNAAHQLVDWGVYVEDAQGGYWTLASGNPVRTANGSTVARPTLEQVLAQANTGGTWRLEQMWTSTSRSALPQFRAEAPYLVTVNSNRATVLDYGIHVTDAQGSYWRLASGAPITNAAGASVARAQLADVLAMPTQGGAQWRTEDFAAPEASFSFDKTAVYYKGNVLTDYAVRVTDAQGSFYVWAHNLERALDYQTRYGVNGYGLRNYALDLNNLRDADNSADSYVRAELISANQLRFAASAYGITFQPELLQAQVSAQGQLQYTPTLSVSDATDFMGRLMDHYTFMTRAAAVRLAAQGGLADYFRGLRYDPSADTWVPTTDREIAPMFEAIFEHAPAGRDATAAYLAEWGRIMKVIYPDLRRANGGQTTEAFGFQMVVAAYENRPVDADLLTVADTLNIDEDKIILHTAAQTTVDGTSGNDLIYMTVGNQTYRGGLGSDVYVIGRNFGQDIIEEYEGPLLPHKPDSVRFAQVRSDQVTAYKDGLDLIIQVNGSTDRLTIRNQFEGVIPGLFGGDMSADTEIVEITFADGITWDALDIAWATSHPLNTDDVVQGTPVIDVLDGAGGNDILRGGQDSDLYVFKLGYGRDRIEDANDNVLVDAIDLVQFGEGITANSLKLQRLGDSKDLIIKLTDAQGNLTGDVLTLGNQFWSINTWILGVHWLDRIERLTFTDGSFLAEADLMRITLEQAKTEGNDALYGYHNEDKLDGGAGNDFLSGGDEGDTYVFGRGYGHDVIEDNLTDFFSPSYDILQFNTGITADDLILVRDGASMTVTLVVRDTQDKLTLNNQYKLTSTILFGDYYYDNVDEIRFGDGSVWDMDSLARRLLAQARTDGNDTIYGFDRNDLIDGGAGNDRLEGGVYSDTYIYQRGYGNDTIYDASNDMFLDAGTDTLELRGINFADVTIARDREDLRFTVRSTGESITLSRQYNRYGDQENAIERLQFADQLIPYTDLNPEDVDLVGTDGHDTLYGTLFAETIDGRGGNDTMFGSSDGDRYRWDAGYGQDVIVDTQESAQWFNDDTVLFGANVSTSNIRFTKDGNDLLITLADRPDTLRIRNQFLDTLNGVERFQFSNGTVWGIRDVENLLAIAGGGRGDDVIVGVAEQPNVLDGRQGDDRLEGGRAGDTYLFGLGYDLDTIVETTNPQAGAADRVVFGALITPDDVKVSRGGNNGSGSAADLVFSLPGSGDELRITQGLSERQVERFEFADGTVWSLDDVRNAMLRSSDGDDDLQGFDDRNDVLDGGLGADELAGGLGNDVYHFGAGYGDDAITDTGGIDQIAFGKLLSPDMLRLGRDGDNLVIHFDQLADSLVLRDVLGSHDQGRIESLVFDSGFALSFDQLLQTLIDEEATAGDDIVTGFANRGDLLRGGAGADLLIGLDGDDTYQFAAGDGLDIVDDLGYSTGDRILITQRASSEASVRRASPTSADVIISFNNNADQILIRNGLSLSGQSVIERIEFADNLVWTTDDLRSKVLQQASTAGDDVLTGFAGDDDLNAGRGNDWIDGSDGADTYRYTRGDGRDLISDSSYRGDQVDTLRIEGYTPDDVRVLRPSIDRDDLLLVLGDNGDEITLRYQASTTAARGLEQVLFGDGTRWSRTDLVDRISTGGSNGDDNLHGSDVGETLAGLAGNDRLSGHRGHDIYVFTRGDGQDTIRDDGQWNDFDQLNLVGYTLAQLVVGRSLYDPDTLELSFTDSADRITIIGGLRERSSDSLEAINIGGDTLTLADLRDRVLQQAQTAGDDRLIGFETGDTLAAGPGRDSLFGGNGSDTYVFAPSDGADTIFDSNGSDDVLRLRLVTEAQLQFETDAADRSNLVIRRVGSQDVLTIVGGLGSNWSHWIERIELDDGQQLSQGDIVQRLVDQQQTAGHDRIEAFSDNEQLQGGTGDDTLIGGDGSDLYIYNSGDGNDRIRDQGQWDNDRVLLRGLMPSDVRFQIAPDNPDNLLIHILATGHTIRIDNTLNGSIPDEIEEFVFGDGTLWTIDDVKTRLVTQASTSGQDRIIGTDADDLISAGPGRDWLSGGRGDDTYIYRRGDGPDTIVDAGAFDTNVVKLVGITPAQVQLSVDLAEPDMLVLDCGQGDVLRIDKTLDVYTWDSDIARVEFDNGTVWTMEQIQTMLAAKPAPQTVQGTTGDDTLEATASSDVLAGDSGSDRYIWRRGDGPETIIDASRYDSATDTLELPDLTPAQVTLEQRNNHLVIRVAPSTAAASDGGELEIAYALSYDYGRGIERISFGNGVVWTIADARQQLLATLQTNSDDVIKAFDGNDTLQGGAGNDVIDGGEGSDTFIWRRGDGNDVLSDENSHANAVDTLRLTGVLPSAVTVSRLDGDAILTIAPSAAGAADGGTLRLLSSLNPYMGYGFEQIVFDNGTTWTPASLRSMLTQSAQTPGNDRIEGFTTADTFDAGRGDDVIDGGQAEDSYIWRYGDGSDTLRDGGSDAGSDVLRLIGVPTSAVTLSRDGDNLTIEIAESSRGLNDGGRIRLIGGLESSWNGGVETIRFESTTGSVAASWTRSQLRTMILAQGAQAAATIVTGFSSDDTLDGAAGADVLNGGDGNDRYIWRRGDGNDVIDEATWFEGNNDILELHGVTPAQVRVLRGEGTDVVFEIAPSSATTNDGARLTLLRSINESYERGIEQVVFDDGTVWLQASFGAQALLSSATEGDDQITGSDGDDRILGRAGNDQITGSNGDDVYVFRRGDGRDVLSDRGYTQGDVIEIQGYSADQARFTRSNAETNDLQIRFIGSDDTITVLNGLAGGIDVIETVSFVDSLGAVVSTFTLAQISGRLLLDASTDGNDLIIGTGADDTLGGGKGIDVLEGGSGNDVFVYRRGDGIDRIDDHGYNASDVLRLTDLRSTDLITVHRSPPSGGDLVLDFGQGDVLTLTGLLGGGSQGVDRIEFADGVVWDNTTARQRVLQYAATSGDESLFGFDSDDVLAGGRGDDNLYGGDGSDTYRYGIGDGRDAIEDNGQGDTDRLDILGYRSTQASVSRYYKGDDGLVIRFAGSTTDSITILNTLNGSAEDGIEQIRFADGVTWTMADVRNLLSNHAPVAAHDGLYSVVQGRELALAQAQLLANDYDADADTLAVIAVGQADHGSVRLAANGSIIYTAAADYAGLASFSYTVSDGRSGQATQTVSLRIRPPASATDDHGLSTAEDTALQITARRLLANDFDGDLMVLSQVLDAQHGSVSLSSNGDISFTPQADFNGQASFRYVANTADGGRAEATVTIDITPVNDGPTARADSGFSTLEGTPLTLTPAQLMANDSDPDSALNGDTLRIASVVGNAQINAALNAGGQIVITPQADFFGNSRFSYTLVDAAGLSSTAEVSIDVIPVNDAPVLANDNVEVDEDTPLLIDTTTLLANDRDAEGERMVVTRVFDEHRGNAQLLANGTILFTPEGDYYGQAGFSYEVSDGHGGWSTAEVTIQLRPINDAPNARDNSYGDQGSNWLRGREDTPLSIPIALLLANDNDRDSVAINLRTVSNALHGSVAIVGNNVVFTPQADYWGEASFRYVVADSEGAIDDAEVKIWLAPVGDAPPVAGDDEISIFEDVTTVIPVSVLLANDTDIDRDPLTITSIAPFSVLDAHAVSLSRNANGDLVIAPTANVNGMFALTYTVTDNADGSDNALIYLTITPVNDDPVAVADTAITSLDAPLVIRLADLPLNDTDLDFGDDTAAMRAALHVISVQNPSRGTVWMYQNAAGQNEFAVLEAPAGASGAITVNYTLADEADGRSTGVVNGTISASRASVINGSARRDLLIGTPGAETLQGQDGDDDLFGRAGDDVLEGGAGVDKLDGGDGSDTASYSTSNIGVRADLQSRIGQGGHAQGDSYTAMENLTGSAYADQLYGDGSVNRLAGGADADLLDGRGGNDVLDGGDGDDRLIGGAGSDQLNGGAGKDTADYSDSASPVHVSLRTNTASGGDAQGDTFSSVENLIGTVGADTLEGDDTANTLSGSRGADRLTGGAGDDWLDGGRDGDVLEGGDGSDTADYASSQTGVTVDLSGQTAGGGDAQGDTFTSIENLRGSFHDDVLRGNSGNNRLEGGAGADQLIGNGGFDTADYHASATPVSVNLGTGTGSAGDAQGDTLQGIQGVIGSAFNDTLTGSDAANRLEGGRGNDTLIGGAGSDDYVFGLDSGTDIVRDVGAATDTDRLLLGEGVTTAMVGLARQGDHLVIDLERGEGFLPDVITVENHFAGTASGLEQIVFANGTVWSRADMALRVQSFRLQAADDLVRWADEDAPFPITAATLLANDTDVPADGLRISSVSNITGSQVSVAADGSINFISTANFNGDASFRYTVTDVFGRESSANVRVVVRPVNDRPTAGNNGIYQGSEDVALVIPIADLLANDADIDGDTLRITGFGELIDEVNGAVPADLVGLVGSGTNGRVGFDLFGPNVLFFPTADFYGAGGFSYAISDGAGGVAVANVRVQISAVNDAPRPTTDQLTARTGVPLSFAATNLLSNDTDPEGDTITLLRVGNASHGSVSLNNGQIVFTSDADYLGDASFDYVVTDGRNTEATGSVIVRVIPVNDVPSAGNDSFTTSEDIPLVLTPAQLLANDSDPNGDTLTISRLDANPEKGSVAFDSQGRIVFTPNSHYNGQASFFYWISDGRGGEARGTVNIEVVAGNDNPYVNDDGPYTTVEDTPLTLSYGQLFANDGDVDGDVLRVVQTEVANGTVEVLEAGLRFTPSADYVGPAVIRYRAGDDKNGVSPTWATVSITVTAARDLPDVVTDTYTINPDQVLTVTAADLLNNDFDLDGDPIRLTGVGNANNGVVERLVDGSIRFTPTAAFTGDAGYDYTITDDREGPVTGRVQIIVRSNLPGNRLPVANTDSFTMAEDGSVDTTVAALLANDTDPDGHTVRFVSIDEETPHGRATLLPGNQIVFTPDEDYVGTISYGYTITDGVGADVRGTINITVTAVNDAPDAADDYGFATITDTPLVLGATTLLANDSDVEGDAFTLVGVSTPLNGTVALANGQITFTPRAGFNGGAAFTYTVRDVHGAESSAQVSLAVRPTNFAPFANDDTGATVNGLTLAEEGVLEIPVASLLANDSDPEGDVIRITAVSAGVGGTAELLDPTLPTARVRFTGASNFTGNGTFSYTLTDATGRSDTATVTLSVTPVNDPPLAQADSASTTINTAVRIPILSLLANDSDPDGNSFQLTSVGNAVNGTAALDGLGNVLFTPATSYTGNASFSYTITDIAGSTASSTVTVEVLASSTPTAGPDRLTGTSGNDLLDGLGGDDILIGLAGNDRYVIAQAGDRIIEAADEGADVAQTLISYTLPDQVEDIEMQGSADLAGSGNALNNRIVGNGGNNWIAGNDGNDSLYGGAGSDTVYGNTGGDLLYGGDGDDWLDGGSGNDYMAGGAGNDRYVVDSAGDVIEETADGGLDTVEANGNYVLYANLENLVLTGAAVNGSGNNQGNWMQGNAAGNWMGGGDGNDSIDGQDGADSLHGDAGDDVLIGGAGNDELEGGTGTDAMYGGAGDDRYIITESADAIYEDAGAGTDTVIVYIDNYVPFANTENILLAGSALSASGNAANNWMEGTSGHNFLGGGDGHDRLLGFAGNDWLQGDDGDDTLEGGDGQDILFGGFGVDTLIGGAGDDTYYVDGPGDIIVEAADGGVDTVYSTGHYTLSGNLENLVITGSQAVNGTGDSGGNWMQGNAAANVLAGLAGADYIDGGAGDDTLAGGTGNDTLLGGAGADTYQFNAGDGQDTLTDTDSTAGVTDRLVFGTGIDANELWLAQSGQDLVITVGATGAADRVTVSNWFASSANQIEQIVDGAGRTLSSSQVAALVSALAASGQAAPVAGAVWSSGQQSALDLAVAGRWA